MALFPCRNLITCGAEDCGGNEINLAGLGPEIGV
jgi:hypothetical protein